MPLVDILCLANSNKEGGRCVAGLRTDGSGWVRPIAPDTPDGQLYFKHYKLDDGSEPAVLDVIGVDLEEPRPIPGQPENWAIGPKPWVLRQRPAGAELRPVFSQALVRGPLLFGSSGRTVKVAEAGTSGASCALVAPASTRWSLESRKDRRMRPRAEFRLGAQLHDLPVTDPLWISRIIRALGAMEAGWYENETVGMPAHGKLWLTISLSEPYEGVSYKLASAVIIPPTVTSSSKTELASARHARL